MKRMKQNEYCDLIDKVCMEVVPGYTIVPKLTLTGRYNPDLNIASQNLEINTLSIKIKFGGA